MYVTDTVKIKKNTGCYQFITKKIRKYIHMHVLRGVPKFIATRLNDQFNNLNALSPLELSSFVKFKRHFQIKSCS